MNSLVPCAWLLSGTLEFGDSDYDYNGPMCLCIIFIVTKTLIQGALHTTEIFQAFERNVDNVIDEVMFLQQGLLTIEERGASQEIDKEFRSKIDGVAQDSDYQNIIKYTDDIWPTIMRVSNRVIFFVFPLLEYKNDQLTIPNYFELVL